MSPKKILLAGFFAPVAIVVMAQDMGTSELVRANDAVAAYVDADGRSTTVVTGFFGQVISGIDAAGLTTTIDRDTGGRPVRTTLPSGAVTNRIYDARGNVRSIDDQVLGGITTVTYEPTFNFVESVTDPLMGQTTAAYDSHGNLAQISTPMGRVATATYTGNGLLETLTDTLGMTLVITYNADQLPITQMVAAGPATRTAQTTYTAEGYDDVWTDAEGHTTDFAYDTMGRVVLATLPDSREIGFGYDPAGNMTSITPPGREAYLFEYDEIGMLVTKRYPAVTGGGSNQTNYTYNQTRQLTAITRADGVGVTLNYDDAGRLQQVVQPNGTFTVNYDAATGLLQSKESPDGISQTLSYNDDVITQVAWAGPVVGDVGYDYDSKGRLTTVSIAGQDFNYTYNADDDVTGVGAMTLTYDATTGLHTSRTLGGLVENFGHNVFGELISHIVDFGPTTLYDTQYSRDRIGRITQAIETIDGTTTTTDYTYDLAGRLATVREGGSLTATYTYDDNDNRTDNAAVYDAQDRIISQGAINYAYNAHGERIQKTVGAAVTAYQYDAGGTLTGATLPGGDQLTYQLDGDSRRAVKLVNGTKTEAWIYLDALNPAARLDATNAITQRYVYINSQIHVPTYVIDGASEFLLIKDHRASVRLVVDANNGSIVQRIDYDAWGQIINDTNPGLQPFAFAGGHYDRDTSLHHFGFREYDAASSSWTSKDPSGFDGSPFNSYSYVNADPINRIDPTGLETSEDRGPVLARIEHIDGTAMIRLAGSKNYRPARVGDTLCKGDRLKTNIVSRASTRFELGGRANLDRGSTVEFTSERDIKIIDVTLRATPYTAALLNSFGGNVVADTEAGRHQVTIPSAGGVLGTKDGVFNTSPAAVRNRAQWLADLKSASGRR